MSSPNEPGAIDKGDSLNGDGSGERSGAHRATPAPTGPGPETGDSPPWQRGAAWTSRAGQRPAPESAGEPRSSGLTPNADARLNRFISGHRRAGCRRTRAGDFAAAGGRRPPPRGDAPSTDAYASELPDLSGPTPAGRAAQTRARAQFLRAVGHRETGAVEQRRCGQNRANNAKAGSRCHGEAGVRCVPACRSAGSTRGAR